MKRSKWQVLFSLGLIGLSVVLYYIHYKIFSDARHIFIYLLGDIAFLPIEVLLVTLILDRLLAIQEKRSMMHKLNMVIGAFFSEVGRELLSSFANFNPNMKMLRESLMIKGDWNPKDFLLAKNKLENIAYVLEAKKGDLQLIKDLLVNKRDFLLGLLENPNLLEHERFTELLWAVFHLTEEVSFRKSLKQLPDSDYEHLSKDMQRAYRLLVLEWLIYMGHLKRDYPYLFSLAVRTNPFDPHASVEVK